MQSEDFNLMINTTLLVNSITISNIIIKYYGCKIRLDK